MEREQKQKPRDKKGEESMGGKSGNKRGNYVTRSPDTHNKASAVELR